MSRGKIWLIAVPLCLAAGIGIFSGPIMRAMGTLLINDGPPVPADLIVVLAGDSPGGRLLKGAELGREGFAPAVLVSNGGSDYSHTEAELAVEFGILHGYSPDLFIPAKWSSFSTAEECREVLREFRKRGGHKLIVVTSLWHTARTSRIYHRNAPDLEIHVVSAGDPNWNDGKWWITREGRKIFFLESVKSFADFLRL